MRYLVFLISFFSVIAQEGVKPKNVVLSYGDSAFTSGLNVAMMFSLKPDRDLELVGNSERFYATMNFKTAGGKLSLDATGGVFKELPWAGPRVVYTPVKQVMFLYWGGVSAGRIGALKAEPKSFCQQLSFYVMPSKYLSVGYNVVKLDVYKTTHLPEVVYHYQLMKDVKLGVSATYDTTAQKPLFSLFLAYTFPKK